MWCKLYNNFVGEIKPTCSKKYPCIECEFYTKEAPEYTQLKL